MRIDKLLWFLRLVKTRGQAQTLVAAGHIRLNRRRIERPAQGVSPGDMLVLPRPGGVRVIVVVALPERRGSPAEALACYRTLDGCAANPIAAGQSTAAKGNPLP